MKKIEELKKLDIAKLNEELNESRKALFKIKFEVKSGQAKGSHLINSCKKQVARIKTLLKEMELIENAKKEIVKN